MRAVHCRHSSQLQHSVTEQCAKCPANKTIALENLDRLPCWSPTINRQRESPARQPGSNCSGKPRFVWAVFVCLNTANSGAGDRLPMEQQHVRRRRRKSIVAIHDTAKLSSISVLALPRLLCIAPCFRCWMGTWDVRRQRQCFKAILAYKYKYMTKNTHTHTGIHSQTDTRQERQSINRRMAADGGDGGSIFSQKKRYGVVLLAEGGREAIYIWINPPHTVADNYRHQRNPRTHTRTQSASQSVYQWSERTFRRAAIFSIMAANRPFSRRLERHPIVLTSTST